MKKAKINTGTSKGTGIRKINERLVQQISIDKKHRQSYKATNGGAWTSHRYKV
jgi:hypothetical protein